jgi:protein TonB
VLAACAARRPPQAVWVPLPPPDRSIAELEAALRSADPAERSAAAWQLAGAGSVPDPVRTLLNAAASDADERVRLAAVWAMDHLRVKPGADKPAGPLTDYDAPPRLVHQTRPVYPEDAFTQKVQGLVEVEMLIGERGEVAHAEIRRSIPPLDAAALETVREWKFTPATKGGRPVATTAVAPVTFRIH